MEQTFCYPQDMIDLATYAGKYRKALVDQGVPDGLADQLVRDWHQHALRPWGEQNETAARLTNVEHFAEAQH